MRFFGTIRAKLYIAFAVFAALAMAGTATLMSTHEAVFGVVRDVIHEQFTSVITSDVIARDALRLQFLSQRLLSAENTEDLQSIQTEVADILLRLDDGANLITGGLDSSTMIDVHNQVQRISSSIGIVFQNKMAILRETDRLKRSLGDLTESAIVIIDHLGENPGPETDAGLAALRDFLRVASIIDVLLEKTPLAIDIEIIGPQYEYLKILQDQALTQIPLDNSSEAYGENTRLFLDSFPDPITTFQRLQHRVDRQLTVEYIARELDDATDALGATISTMMDRRLLATADAEAAIVDHQRRGNQLAISFAVLTVIIALLLAIVIVSKGIIARLAHVSHAMRSYSAGQGEPKVPVGGNDEISEMARILEGLLRNTDELAVTKERLEAAIIEARAANAAKNNFLAHVSHELRTPLNAIVGFAGMMRSEALGPIANDYYRDYAGDIEDAGSHLSLLINDILDISRIELNELALHEEETQIDNLIAEVAQMLHLHAKEVGIGINIDQVESAVFLMVDSQRIKQVLINILFNAIKFSPANSTISVAAKLTPDGRFQITVADQGVGIPTEHIETIMQPFGQIKNAYIVGEKGVGVGLGLPLSKSLMALHDGRLFIKSEVGLGTSVSIDFPPDRVLNPPKKALSW